MGLSTAFTDMFGVAHPIALAPMGGSAGGALAAAVSRGGGLGLLGAGNGDPDWLARELPVLAREVAGKPWGIGFQTWAIDDGAIARALEHGPDAVMLSFGDPGPFAERVRAAGTALILQVTDMEEARRAVDLGADVIVAQGTEAGGHGARHGRSTLPFVPVVVDLAAPVPVLDIVRGSRWPARYTARTLAHPFLDEWRGREDELAASADAKQAYRDAVAAAEVPAQPRWAGEGVDLIDDLPSAADLVGALAVQAEEALARAGGR
ncbi:nitronate monooxygenase [Actinomadura sp. NPDC048394]|uniref:NAD(P)H-dependent flavin oxidoreductase n=1 Tax=Actinomadura sp. NPDC048394 TaxID=3158223 RepID=UPI0033E390CB